MRFKRTNSVAISYYCEPERNISLARNRAVLESKGDFLALIDDDELPGEGWLLSLYRTCTTFEAGGVLGPVRPHFEIEPPQWILAGKFFDRRSFATGTIVTDVRYMRTGNVLLRRSVINGHGAVFDRRFGRTGGEDADFFKRKLANGYLFVWCGEAIVYETVPPARLKRGYLIRRAVLRGVGEAALGRLGIFNLCKSLMAIVLYTAALPMFLLTSHHHFMKLVVKDCDHIGKLLAACGLVIVKERSF